MGWKVVFQLRLFVMGSCCHFPIDDYALRDSSDLLSAACKINCAHGWVSLGSLQLPVGGKSSPCLEGRVIINREADGRQSTGCSSHVPYAVAFMGRPERVIISVCSGTFDSVA